MCGEIGMREHPDAENPPGGTEWLQRKRRPRRQPRKLQRRSSVFQLAVFLEKGGPDMVVAFFSERSSEVP